MKKLLIVLFLFQINKVYTQVNQTKDIIKIVFNYNFKRILKGKKPLILDPHLIGISTKLANKLQTQNISDTLIPNTHIIYNQDTIPNLDLNSDEINRIGISLLPHKYNCTILVVILSKNPQFKDLECPRPNKKRFFGFLN